MPPQAFVTSVGERVRLGHELARGGEGVVFDIEGDPNVVAKIYLAAPAKEKQSKLLAMTRGTSDRLLAVAAWPLETLHDMDSGSVRGFLMKRIQQQPDIHVLQGSKSRLREYPDASYRFLVRVARNVAGAFATVHDHGHVIGDVNSRGVCVAGNGVVTLVDCDSFQIGSGTEIFTCDVGMPEFQPPELQGLTSYRGLRRTVDYDAFGLAVILFQTLFLARHPFVGNWVDGGGDVREPKDAIREFRFAYGPGAARRKMKQPPGSLPFDSLSPTVAASFERAFGGDKRPSAHEWIAALDAFEAQLRSCALNPGHAYLKTRSACPLCALEKAAGGRALFLPPRPRSASVTPLTLDEIMRELDEVTREARAAEAQPSLLPRLPPPLTNLSTPALQPVIVRHRLRRRVGDGVFAVGATSFSLLTLLNNPSWWIAIPATVVIAHIVRGRTPPDVEELRQAAEAAKANAEACRIVAAEAEAELQAANQRWKETLDASPVRSLEARARTLADEVRRIETARIAELREFQSDAHQRQLERYLDGFAIEDCGIKGFGSGLIQTLVAYGIEAADDIEEERLEAVPGFGPKRIQALLDWRRRLEAKFQVDARSPDDAKARDRLESRWDDERTRGLRSLVGLVEQLKRGVPAYRASLDASRRQLTSAFHEMQARGHEFSAHAAVVAELEHALAPFSSSLRSWLWRALVVLLSLFAAAVGVASAIR